MTSLTEPTPSPTPTTPAIDPRTNLRLLRRGLLIGRAYYFVFFGAMVNFVAFINVHLQSLGISGTQIGIITAITCIVSIFAPPLVGAIADRWQLHKPVLVVAGLLAGLSALLFFGVTTFTGVLMAMILMSTFKAPIPGIVDATVIDLANRAHTTYGLQRIWGGIGWMVLSFLTGQMVARWGTEAIFLSQFLLMGVVSVVLALLLPVERSSERVDYAAGFRHLTRLRAYRGILVLNLALGIGDTAYLNFGAIYILALGGTAALVGLMFTTATLTEVPTMAVADKWIGRIGLRNALIVASVGFGLSWLLAAFATHPWIMLAAVAISGIFTGIIWATLAPYTLMHAPRSMGATAINLGAAAFAGVGFALGALMGGFLLDTFGGGAIFFASFVVVMAGTVFFAWATRTREPSAVP